MSKFYKYGKFSKLLTFREKQKYIIYIISQVFVGILDLLGLALLTVISMLGLRGNDSVPNKIFEIAPALKKILIQDNLAALAIICGILFLLKTLFSFLQTNSILKFATRIQNRLTDQIFSGATNFNMRRLASTFNKEMPSALTEGIESLALGVIGYSLLAIAELILLVALVAPLLIFAPQLTIPSIGVFAFSFYAIYKLTAHRARKAAKRRLSLFGEMRTLMLDISKVSKILKIQNNFAKSRNQILYLESEASLANSQIHLLHQIPKYILEITVIVSSAIIGLFLSLSNDVVASLSVTILFTGTILRLLPSMLRFQGFSLIVRASVGESSAALSLLSEIESISEAPVLNLPQFKTGAKSFAGAPGIDLSNIYFKYPDSEKYVIENFSCAFNPGEITVIKGSSGAGKTTLVDIALGLLEPTVGFRKVLLPSDGDFSPGYMPQDTQLVHATISENIALGVSINEIDNEKVLKLLEIVGLAGWLEDQKYGLSTLLGESSLQLSGGQKQRIGLARSLYLDPNFLVVDEPTSALDGISEDAVLDVLNGLKGVTTIIIIAHSNKPEKIADALIDFA